MNVLETSGFDSIDDLPDALVLQKKFTQGGIPGVVYFRKATQFIFAVNRHVGKLTDQKD